MEDSRVLTRLPKLRYGLAPIVFAGLAVLASADVWRQLTPRRQREVEEVGKSVRMSSSCSKEMSSASSSTSGRPTVMLVLGMAGSGKTSLVTRLASHANMLYQKNKASKASSSSSSSSGVYLVNLDPACLEVPFPASIDIRDTVNYREVMRQYGLGPNGGIVTSLNLFATKFDQVLDLLSKRSDDELVIVDTPGQIEVFTWSASGTIMSEALASRFPTVVLYVLDLERSQRPVTFMSNMLYACSILYKTKLPFIIALNKSDVVRASYAQSWMEDFDNFEQAVTKESSYVANLARSLSLALDEFYTNIKHVALSAMSGEGVDQLVSAINEARKEYETDFRPNYERRLRQGNKEEEKKKENKKGNKVDLLHTMHEEEQGSILLGAVNDDESEEGRDFDEELSRREDDDSFLNFVQRHKDHM